MMFTFEYQEVTTATVVTRCRTAPYVGNLIARSGAAIEQQTCGQGLLVGRRIGA